MRRIGVLMSLRSGRSGTTGPPRAHFVQGLQELGWTDGRNVQIDVRWAAIDCRSTTQTRGGIGRARTGRDPGRRRSGCRALCKQATRTVPIVFIIVTDPVGGGLVDSLARPGGNITGFTSSEYGLSGKWLELLKDIAPRVIARGGPPRPCQAAGIGQLAAIQAVAPSLRVEIEPRRCARRGRDRARRRGVRAIGRMAG